MLRARPGQGIICLLCSNLRAGSLSRSALSDSRQPQDKDRQQRLGAHARRRDKRLVGVSLPSTQHEPQHPHITPHQLPSFLLAPRGP